jgi:hypothetical protein
VKDVVLIGREELSTDEWSEVQLSLKYLEILPLQRWTCQGALVSGAIPKRDKITRYSPIREVHARVVVFASKAWA